MCISVGFRTNPLKCTSCTQILARHHRTGHCMEYGVWSAWSARNSRLALVLGSFEECLGSHLFEQTQSSQMTIAPRVFVDATAEVDMNMRSSR